MDFQEIIYKIDEGVRWKEGFRYVKKNNISGKSVRSRFRQVKVCQHGIGNHLDFVRVYLKESMQMI